MLVESVISPGPKGARIRDRIRHETLHAPAVVDYEILSAFRGLVLGGWVTDRFARKVITRLFDLPILRSAPDTAIGRILDLRDNLTAYDASYVALAETLHCTLLTTDRRLAAAPGIRCPVEVVS